MPSMIQSPSARMLEKAPRWDLTGTVACGGGKVFWWMALMVWEYLGIYRAKIRFRGHPRGPQALRARPRGAPPGLWAPRESPNPNSSSIYILKYSPNIRSVHQNTFPPPQASVPVRSHLGAFSSSLPEGDSIMEGFYINLAALLMKCE